jgi:hypothetical protein
MYIYIYIYVPRILASKVSGIYVPRILASKVTGIYMYRVFLSVKSTEIGLYYVRKKYRLVELYSTARSDSFFIARSSDKSSAAVALIRHSTCI